MKLSKIPVLLSVCGLGLGGARGADLLGVTYTGLPTSLDVYRINVQTGGATAVGASGVVLMNDLARSPAGTFWTVGMLSGDLQHQWLIRLDPLTGRGTPGPALNFGGVDFESADALACSPAGELFAVSGNDYLFKINTSTGVGTSMGQIGVPGYPIGVNALAFAPDGTLYGWGVERYGLIRIDPQTAAYTDVSTSYGGGGQIQGMTFGDDGILYGAYNSLYRINTTTGEAIPIGSGFSNVRGIAVVPEPSVSGLYLFGLLSFLVVPRRRVGWRCGPGVTR